MIREARAEDIPALSALLGVLFSQEAEFVADAIKQSQALVQIISDPETGSILVCSEGDEIVAMVNLLYTVSTAMGGKAAILEDLVVHPDHRGRGLGKSILRAAIDKARENACLRITLLADQHNEKAIGLYRGQGFKRSSMLPLRLVL